jgi:cellulose synthase (UDP-forming)
VTTAIINSAPFRTLASLIVLAVLVVLAQSPAELKTQLVLAGAIGAIMIGAAFWRPSSSWMRIIIILLTVFTSTRYMIWRFMETIPWTEPVSLPFAPALYFAEVCGCAILLLSNFDITDAPPRAALPLVLRSDDLPHVDILIPSYNEEPELLEATLVAALNIDNQIEKRRVYLLDDGGTEQKRTQPDALKVAEAPGASRRAESAVHAYRSCIHHPRAQRACKSGQYQRGARSRLGRSRSHS